MWLIVSLAMLGRPGMSWPAALAALRRRLLKRASSLNVCSSISFWRIAGSAALPLAFASRVSDFDDAPNSVAPPPPLRPPLDTKSPARRSRSPATVPAVARHAPARPPPAAGAEARPLEHQGGVRALPAIVEPADHRVVAHPGLAEEHLVEQRPAGHLAQRPHLDARLAHVDDEVRDPGVLGLVGVGAGDEHAQIGDVATGGPDLLAGDDPLFAILLGPALQPRQVGPGSGLAEELAPASLPGDDVAQVARLLVVVSVNHDRRAGEHQAEAAGGRKRAEVGDRLLDPVAVVAAEVLAEPRAGPRGDGPARGAEPLPPVGHGELWVPVVDQPVLDLGHDVGTHLDAIGGFGHDRKRSMSFPGGQARRGDRPWPG